MSLRPVFQIFYPIFDCNASKSDFGSINGWSNEAINISRKLTCEGEYSISTEESTYKSKKRNSLEGDVEINDMESQIFKLEYTYEQNLSILVDQKWATPEQNKSKEEYLKFNENWKLLNAQFHNRTESKIKTNSQKYSESYNSFNNLNIETNNCSEIIGKSSNLSDNISDEVSNFQIEQKNLLLNKKLNHQASAFEVDQSTSTLKDNIKNLFKNFLNENEEILCSNLIFLRFLKILSLKLLKINLDKKTQALLLKTVKKFDKILNIDKSESFLLKLMLNKSEKAKIVIIYQISLINFLRYTQWLVKKHQY